jgi:transcriptional regulator GlxA family with amidase domain
MPMRRRDFLQGSAAMAAALLARKGAALARDETRTRSGSASAGPMRGAKLVAGTGRIPVAFAISEGVVVIDFSGPWEVFQDLMLPERGGDMEHQMPFDLFTVSETTAPLRGSGGLQYVPDHTFATAPPARVIVVPAQRGGTALHEWLRHASKSADVTMSVCTGAFQLAKAGLLSGLDATTHHDALDRLASQFPDVRVKRGVRFVENERISTAGGLTSGIDLALRVVERYFGRPASERTAAYMEYQSRGWIV